VDKGEVSLLRLLALGLAALALKGCLAKAAVGVATAPVRVVSKGVDLATTSQSEADEKRGRAIRKYEERLAELEATYNYHMDQCSSVDAGACDAAKAVEAEIEELRKAGPAGPDSD